MFIKFFIVLILAVSRLSKSSTKIVCGAPGGIWTPDLPVRSRTLYPTKLLVHTLLLYRVEIYFSRENEKISKKIVQKLLQISLICDIIYKRSNIEIKYRGVAQLVARVVWDHEVAGSIPVTSTILLDFLRNFRKF